MLTKSEHAERRRRRSQQKAMERLWISQKQRVGSTKMVETLSENVVAAAMQPITDSHVPTVLRANIQRQSEKLMGLAITLLESGMDEQQVRSIVDLACSSYRDELTATILALRDHHEN